MVDTTEGNEDETTLSKKPRLSIACNECRRRKVKCDAEYPKCRNCLLRDAECVTTDLRRGEKLAAREWVQQPSASIAARLSGNRRASNQARVLFNPGSEHANDRFSLASTAPAQADQNQQRAYAGTPSTANFSMPHDTEVSSIGISPVHQPLGNSYNYDTSSKKTKVQGPSSSQCLSRSLDVFFRSADFEPITPLFLHGMRHVEEMAVEASMEWPEMPGNEARELYVSTFNSRVLPLFPVVVVDQLKSDIAILVARPRLNDIQSEQIPMLITIYLVFSLGVDEAAQRPTKLGDQFLRAAASRMSYLILTPYIQSLQCLLLFTVAFRGRNKDGLGWQTLGMAIRMAQSLGLHDTHPYPATDSNRSQQDHDAQLHQYRLWTTCCFLEGMMQLESGRPSSLSVLDIENVLHDRDFRGQHSQNNAILKWMTELAHFQQRISQHIYAYRPGSRSARQLLFDTAELDQALTAWVDTIPIRYRPSTELSCTDDDLPSAALLDIQYHQTMIALHRAALIAPATSFDIEVSSLLPNHPSQFRVRKGETICVNSSRAIARTAIDLDDRKAGSRALNVSPILLACIVLAIALMKEPTSRLRAADLSVSVNTSIKCQPSSADPLQALESLCRILS